jgi:hypothetical protein
VQSLTARRELGIVRIEDLVDEMAEPRIRGEIARQVKLLESGRVHIVAIDDSNTSMRSGLMRDTDTTRRPNPGIVIGQGSADP